MPWKAMRSSQYRNVSDQEWEKSSGGDHSYQRKVQQPATSASEALWRAAKRLGSAWRWLKIDLALLAEEKQHQQLMSSMEGTVTLFGHALLPDLGLRPLSRDVLAQPDVFDFVIILSCMNTVREIPKQDGPDHCEQLLGQVCATEFAPPQKQSCGRQAAKQRNSSAQTVGDYMVRNCLGNISGDWVPLDKVTTRRGTLVRCTDTVKTSNAEVSNMTLERGDVFKIVDVDADGDFRVVGLEDAGVAELQFPSKRHWLLQHVTSGKAEAWLPRCASSDCAQKKRELRKNAYHNDEG